MGEENNNNNNAFVKTTTTKEEEEEEEEETHHRRNRTTTNGKETTIYVGKIPSEISNERIQSILKTCGNLTEWKRTRDIEAPFRYKPFGFATFETLEGVLAAMRVLDGMQLYENVDDAMKARTETLLLNVNQATKMAAEKFNAEREEKGLGAKDGEEDYERKRKIEKIMKGEMDVDEDDDEKEKKTKKDKIDAAEFSEEDEEEIKSGAKRVTATITTTTTTTTTTKSSQEKLRTTSVLTNQISTNKSTSEGGTKTETTCAKTVGTMQQEDGEVVRMGEHHSNQGDNNVPAKPLTKRQREEKRREDEKRRIEQREFGRKERQWLDEERIILNERNKRMRRYRDEKNNVERTRASRRKRDDDDRQLNAWERDERDLDRRKRFRERELEAEEKDRQNEIEEIEEAKRDEEKRLEEERKKKLSLEKAKKEKTVKETTIAGFSKRKKTKSSEDGGAEADVHDDDDDDDDDETTKLNKKRRRQFVPIEYTEAEKRIVAAGLTVEHKDADDQDQRRFLEEEKKRKAALEASIMDKIPTKKNDVFNYDIDWGAFKTSGAESLCRKWVSKKTVELLGEEEDAVVDFVIEKLRERVDASVLLEELAVFLDEEAESFVLKLWRMIIYETLKFKSKS